MIFYFQIPLPLKNQNNVSSLIDGGMGIDNAQSPTSRRPNNVVISQQWMDEMKIKQSNRLEHKQTICKNGSVFRFQQIQSVPRWLFDLSYSNDDYKFFISTVWKAGSIHWKEVLRQLHAGGSIDFRNRQPDPVMPMNKMSDLYTKLDEYYKIIFVRHPFSRLLSAWRDKIFEADKPDDSNYYRIKGRRIVKTYRPGASKRELFAGNATFIEFATWVTSSEVDNDFHWFPISRKYDLCRIPYDFIGKIETAYNDTTYLFKLLGIERVVSYPAAYSHIKSGNSDLLREYYGDLPSDLINKLVEKFKDDFTIFGYHLPTNKTDFINGIDLIGT